MISIYSRPEIIRYKAPAEGDTTAYIYIGFIERSLCGRGFLVPYGLAARTGVRSTDPGSAGKHAQSPFTRGTIDGPSLGTNGN